MSYKIYNNFRLYLLVYLIFVTISSILFLNDTYLLTTNNSIAEWLINYQGGFGRRGFLGEIFLEVSSFTKINLKQIIFYFLVIFILTYHYLLFLFLKNLKFNIFFIIAVLSPLFVIFPIAEIEALGRKDILIPTLFLILSLLYQKLDINKLSIVLLFSYTILILTHEVSIFYLPFFYFFIFSKIKKFDLNNLLLILFISTYFLTLIYFLTQSNFTEVNIEKMCNYLIEIHNTRCGLGAYVLNRSLDENIAELGLINFFHVTRAIWIFFLGFIGLIIIVPNTIFNLDNSKIFFLNHINFFKIFLLLWTPTLIPFFIAVDWGRWFNLSYTMSFLFYFFCLRYELIKFENKHLFKQIKIFFEKKIFIIFFLFLFCFSWNPKAIYLDDLGSIPIYRIINKLFR